MAYLYFCLQNEENLVAPLVYSSIKRVSTNAFRKTSGFIHNGNWLN